MTRFAPAPTGYLHLGHVANAIYVWGLARRFGLPVVLRVEDHDAERARRTFETALLDDLDWLGFAPDVHPTAEFRAGPCAGRQSDRLAVYADAAATLIAQGLVYGCACTRHDLLPPPIAGGEGRYPGTCRSLGLPLNDAHTWRLRMDDGREAFDDLLCGRLEQEPAQQCGDVAIRDRRGNWTYQFVASVDDHVQGITLVVRGRDLLASTGRQIRLARTLGRTKPATFAHHPLIMKSPSQKLSKSDGDTGVRDLRARGWSAARVIGEAASAIGLGRPGLDLTTTDAVELLATT